MVRVCKVVGRSGVRVWLQGTQPPGFMVRGLGFRARGSGSGAWGLRIWVLGVGVGARMGEQVWGLGFRG